MSDVLWNRLAVPAAELSTPIAFASCFGAGREVVRGPWAK